MATSQRTLPSVTSFVEHHLLLHLASPLQPLHHPYLLIPEAGSCLLTFERDLPPQPGWLLFSFVRGVQSFCPLPNHHFLCQVFSDKVFTAATTFPYLTAFLIPWTYHPGTGYYVPSVRVWSWWSASPPPHWNLSSQGQELLCFRCLLCLQNPKQFLECSRCLKSHLFLLFF